MLTHRRRGVLRKSDVREANERLILNIVRQNENVSRSDIVRMTGLSPSSVTFIVNRLMSEGLIAHDVRTDRTQTGRPPVSLSLQPQSMYAVGAEISTSGLRIRAADVHGNTLLEKHAAWHRNHQVALTRLRTAIASMLDRFQGRRLLGIAVGVPGTVVRETGQVLAAEDLGWFQVPAGSVLADGLPVKPVIDNDAKLGAFAEHWFHPDGLPSNFVFVAGARGLGTGVFIDGHLLQGASGEGAEFGHTILYPDGRPCLCGGRGCWEEYASARAFERLYRESTGSDANSSEIVSRARQGEASAIAALNKTAEYIGLGFVNLRQAFDPEQIIVGNYLAESWDLIEPTVWNILRDRIAERYLGGLRIQPASHTKDSVLMGAIGLALSMYFGSNDRTSIPAARPVS